MAGNDRRLRERQSLENPLRRELRDVDDHAERIQLADGLLAERGEAVMLLPFAFLRPGRIRKVVVARMREPEQAHTGLVERIDTIEIGAERAGIEEAHD